MRKKVVILANFTQLPNEKGNNRFMYLANLLSKDADVTLVTSSFSHIQKVQREKLNFKDDVNIVQIYEPGYKKNVSFKRFYSHYIFGKNIKKYLNSIEKPDVIYCAMPSLSAAKEAAKYAKSNGIRFVIDVQDLWPEAFKMVFKVPVISNLIFWPFNALANYSYSHADKIVAVSETYANRAIKVNSKFDESLVVYLGTNLVEFDAISKGSKTVNENNETTVVYIGTLGHSYNIKSVIDAIGELKEKYNIKFLVMGEGPLRQEFEAYAKSENINSEFTGVLPYVDMVKRLVNCDIAVNPISKGAAQSIINKVGDYAAAGLPVINTQECEEYRNIVDDYDIGYNCNIENIEEIKNSIEKMILDKEKAKQQGYNNRKLAEERFDRNVTYGRIVHLILK